MDMVVVHPAYWRRGHGTTMVKWGMKLADTDRVRQGVVAAKMGEKLYLSLNYSKLADLKAQDDTDPPSRSWSASSDTNPRRIRARLKLGTGQNCRGWRLLEIGSMYHAFHFM
jgi:hypothetical protein